MLSPIKQSLIGTIDLDLETTASRMRAGQDPSELDNEELRKLVESNPRLSTHEMATTLGTDQSTIVRHLEKLGKVSKLGSWVPHDLTKNQRDRRAEACLTLLLPPNN